MCGRFTQFGPWSEIANLYNLTRTADRARNTEPRYNIAPTQDVPFVHLDGDGNQVVEEGRWWLVPFWAKELTSKWPMFNARSEDAEKKPAFREAYKSKRCLIPADGFYEWTKGDDGKDPWFIHLPDAQPFSFAGLWAHNDVLDVMSCTILTAAAEEPVKQLHNRMPVILDHDAYDEWLDPETSVADAKTLLKRNLNGDLTFHRVGRAVNSSSYQGADAIKPVETE